jgi:hypothetical protein
MKNFLICISLALFLSQSIFSQTSSKEVPASTTKQSVPKDTIQYLEEGIGHKFTLNSEVLSVERMGIIMKDNPTSMQFIDEAKSTTGILTVLSYAGGFMIGYPLGTMIGGGQPNWTMAAIGCGLIAICIPIASDADKKLVKAVQAFNQAKVVSLRDNYELKLGLSQNGLGIAIRF